jgi:hypothetical protein
MSRERYARMRLGARLGACALPTALLLGGCALRVSYIKNDCGVTLSHGVLWCRWLRPPSVATRALPVTLRENEMEFKLVDPLVPVWWRAPMIISWPDGRTILFIPLWLLLGPVGVGAILIRIQRSRHRVNSGCQQCGYDLTGNMSGVCSECGAPIPVIRDRH